MNFIPPKKRVNLCKILNNIKVNIYKHLVPEIKVNKALRQGEAIAPFLFNVVLETAIRRPKEETLGTTLSAQHTEHTQHTQHTRSLTLHNTNRAHTTHTAHTQSHSAQHTQSTHNTHSTHAVSLCTTYTAHTPPRT